MIGREMSDKDVRLLEEAELFIDGKEESVSS
jgi:hypothetical protein